MLLNGFVTRTCLKMIQQFSNAREVSEYLLEQTGQAYRDDNPDAFARCFSLPVLIQTFDGQSTLKTREDILRVYSAVRGYYASLGVTDIVRHCVEALFLDETTVVATHETRLLRDNLLLQRPYPTLSRIKLIDGRWLITSSTYAILDREDHNAALLSAGEDTR